MLDFFQQDLVVRIVFIPKRFQMQLFIKVPAAVINFRCSAVCLLPDDFPGSSCSLQHCTLPGHTHSYPCLLTRCIYLVQGRSVHKPSVQITFRPFGIFKDKWHFFKKKALKSVGSQSALESLKRTSASWYSKSGDWFSMPKSHLYVDGGWMGCELWQKASVGSQMQIRVYTVRRAQWCLMVDLAVV